MKAEKNIHISIRELRVLMRNHDTYLMHIQNRYKFPRRSYASVHGYGSVFQCDLAEMFPYEGFKYFLLVIDIFSRKIWCEAIKQKTAIIVRNAFDNILKRANCVPEKLESDKGNLKHCLNFKRCQIRL